MNEQIMVTMSIEDFRKIIAEEVVKVAATVKEKRELPYFLTPAEARVVLRVSDSKMRELMGRTNFPVCRQIGVKIYTDRLFQWIEKNTNDI